MKARSLRSQRPRTTRRISGRAQQDHILDPYQHQKKLHEGVVCPQCGAVYHQGSWRWMARAEGVAEDLCPACRRINDNFPAGVVTLRGDFA
jgi:NMD protein affecting ribosome stability and mRNA decay